MNQAYLWDTDVAIYYLQQHLPPYVEKVMDDIAERARICISEVTETELRKWETGAPVDFDVTQLFIGVSVVYKLDKDIKIKAAELRKQSDLKPHDAIVAATAVIYGLTLITNNTVDFAEIRNLRLLNPFDPQ